MVEAAMQPTESEIIRLKPVVRRRPRQTGKKTWTNGYKKLRGGLRARTIDDEQVNQCCMCKSQTERCYALLVASGPNFGKRCAYCAVKKTNPPVCKKHRRPGMIAYNDPDAKEKLKALKRKYRDPAAESRRKKKAPQGTLRLKAQSPGEKASSSKRSDSRQSQKTQASTSSSSSSSSSGSSGSSSSSSSSRSSSSSEGSSSRPASALSRSSHRNTFSPIHKVSPVKSSTLTRPTPTRASATPKSHAGTINQSGRNSRASSAKSRYSPQSAYASGGFSPIQSPGSARSPTPTRAKASPNLHTGDSKSPVVFVSEDKPRSPSAYDVSFMGVKRSSPGSPSKRNFKKFVENGPRSSVSERVVEELQGKTEITEGEAVKLFKRIGNSPIALDENLRIPITGEDFYKFAKEEDDFLESTISDFYLDLFQTVVQPRVLISSASKSVYFLSAIRNKEQGVATIKRNSKRAYESLFEKTGVKDSGLSGPMDFDKVYFIAGNKNQDHFVAVYCDNLSPPNDKPVEFDVVDSMNVGSVPQSLKKDFSHLIKQKKVVLKGYKHGTKQRDLLCLVFSTAHVVHKACQTVSGGPFITLNKEFVSKTFRGVMWSDVFYAYTGVKIKDYSNSGASMFNPERKVRRGDVRKFITRSPDKTVQENSMRRVLRPRRSVQKNKVPTPAPAKPPAKKRAPAKAKTKRPETKIAKPKVNNSKAKAVKKASTTTNRKRQKAKKPIGARKTSEQERPSPLHAISPPTGSYNKYAEAKKRNANRIISDRLYREAARKSAPAANTRRQTRARKK